MKKATHFTHNYLLSPNHPLTVNVIGCGGTGSQVLTNLARMHVALVKLGHAGLYVTAWDDDMVEEVNIGRQMFSPADVGQNKATVLISRINRFFGLSWNSSPVRFGTMIPKDRWRDCQANIMITCVDSAKARIDIKKFVGTRSTKNFFEREQSFYWLDFGNGQRTGQVILGTINKIKQPRSKFKTMDTLPTILDMFPDIEKHDTKEEQGAGCSLAESLGKQDLFINSTLAQFGVDLLWKLLRDMKIQSHGVFLNLDTMVTNPIQIKSVA